MWSVWESHAKTGHYPFDFAPYEAVREVVERLIPVFDQDREAWGREFTAAAERHEHDHFQAYGLYRMARYPTPSTPLQQAAYRKSQEHLIAAYASSEAPIERVEMPFAGRPGEGSNVVGYLRRPPNAAKPPVFVSWAGIDTFKEDWVHRSQPFLDRGMATLCVDMPGTGDAPLSGSAEEPERMWDAIFDWLGSRPDLDSGRVGGWGGSTGGYWATRMAHTRRERFTAVISQGGCAHYAFTREWLGQDAHRDAWPFTVTESLAKAFGLPREEDWVEFAPKLSLLDMGILDQPCAPLLCINGVNDFIFPIRDYYLLLEHGGPKTARFFPGGHMGMDAEGSQDHTVPPMVDWMCARLGVGGALP